MNNSNYEISSSQSIFNFPISSLTKISNQEFNLNKRDRKARKSSWRDSSSSSLHGFSIRAARELPEFHLTYLGKSRTRSTRYQRRHRLPSTIKSQRAGDGSTHLPRVKTSALTKTEVKEAVRKFVANRKGKKSASPTYSKEDLSSIRETG